MKRLGMFVERVSGKQRARVSVAEYFDGDAQKVALWFELRNPQLGNISPRNMIRGDRYKRLLNFVLEAREAEAAARRRRT